MTLRNLFLGTALCVTTIPAIGCGGGQTGLIEATDSEMQEYKAQKAEDAKRSETPSTGEL